MTLRTTYETFQPRFLVTGVEALDNFGWFLSSLSQGDGATIRPLLMSATLQYSDGRRERVMAGAHLIELAPPRDTRWLWALLHYGWWQKFSGIGALP